MKLFSSLKRMMALLLAMLMLVTCLQGCTKTTSTDILSQKPLENGRTQLTVLIKHAFSINAFEKAVEAKFPDIDIVQVGNFTPALTPDEYVARLKHDDLTDIVMTWPLSFGEEYLSERLLDLSAFPFTTRYNVSMLDTIAQDGKLRYLPGPAQIRGIVYNKTLFQERNWQVPTNYNEFIALCKTIEASGMRSIQLGFQNPEVLDTAFIGYNFSNCFSSPKDAQWIADYSQGKGEFIEQFGPALDTFQEMIDAGIWQQEDLEIDYSERELSLFTRQCAMVEDSVLIARKGYEIAGSTDEFALMPFFNPGSEGNDWARLYMVCYIGLNQNLVLPENKEKYEKALQIMDYISTPEGQDALAGDTGAMYSSLKDGNLPDIPEIKDLVPALKHGRYAIFSELANVQGALRQGLAGMVAGTMSKTEVAALVDKANTPASVALSDQPLPVLGTAQSTFSIMETGNLITDAMRNFSGSQIALFLDGGKDGRYNNKGVTAKLYEGPLTMSDINRITPDYKYGELGELWKVTMTGENLLKTLEYAIPVDNNSTGWFYYFSGLKMTYDPVADPGQRIKHITLSSGEKIALDQVYSLIVAENTVPEDYLLSCEKTGVLLNGLLADFIQTQGTIKPANDQRFLLP